MYTEALKRLDDLVDKLNICLFYTKLTPGNGAALKIIKPFPEKPQKEFADKKLNSKTSR